MQKRCILTCSLCMPNWLDKSIQVADSCEEAPSTIGLDAKGPGAGIRLVAWHFTTAETRLLEVL
eukprot:6391462-Pyramimonas_sp.AAC.3